MECVINLILIASRFRSFSEGRLDLVRRHKEHITNIRQLKVMQNAKRGRPKTHDKGKGSKEIRVKRERGNRSDRRVSCNIHTWPLGIWEGNDHYFRTWFLFFCFNLLSVIIQQQRRSYNIKLFYLLEGNALARVVCNNLHIFQEAF